MKICAVADIHGQLPAVPACDVLVVAGDVCPHFEWPLGGAADLHGQGQWLRGAFTDWLHASPAGEKIVVWGNHDFIAAKEDLLPRDLPCRVLTDRGDVVLGVTFWGTPWQPWFGDWAFDAPPLDEGGEEFLEEKYRPIPSATAVIVSHGPPYGYGDANSFGLHTGSRALVHAIGRVKPRLVICGHIHEAAGSFQLGDTLVLNAALCGASNRLIRPPFVLDLQPE